MSIVRKDREVTGIHRNGRDTMEVWKFIDGAWRSVWQFIRSCFGRGFWANDKQWSNTDGWKEF